VSLCSFRRDEETKAEVCAVAEGQRTADRLGERELEPIAKRAGVQPFAPLAMTLELKPAQFTAVHFNEIHGLDSRRGFPDWMISRRKSWQDEPMCQPSASIFSRPSRYCLGWRVGTNGVSDRQRVVIGKSGAVSAKSSASPIEMSTNCKSWPPCPQTRRSVEEARMQLGAWCHQSV
jgi:hypothetical protein